MNTDLSINVHCKQQFLQLCSWLIKHSYHFEFETLGTGDSINPETYQLNIYNIPWAANVTEIASIMEQSDYDMGGEEEKDLQI